MGFTFFPVVNGAQVTIGGDSTAKAEPGVIQAYKWGNDQWCLAQYVQNGNVAVIDAGYVAVCNTATLKQWSVMKAGSSQEGLPMAGIALATIGSQKYGWIVIQGYHGSAMCATTASGECLSIGASVSAQLTNNLSSSWYLGTAKSGSAVVPVAIAKYDVAVTGYASVQLIGCWGV